MMRDCSDNIVFTIGVPPLARNIRLLSAFVLRGQNPRKPRDSPGKGHAV
jgi:hypothetical protein